MPPPLPAGTEIELPAPASGRREALVLEVVKVIKEGADGACVLLADRRGDLYVGKAAHCAAGDGAIAAEGEKLTAIYESAKSKGEEPRVPRVMGVAAHEVGGGRTMKILVLEKLQCDATDFVRKYEATMKRPLSLTAALQTYVDMVCSIKQFHDAGMAHTDLNKNNVMYTERAPFGVRLIDATRALYLHTQPLEWIFLGRRATMQRGAPAYQGHHAFRGRPECGRGDLSAAFRCCLDMVATKAQGEPAPNAAFAAVKSAQKASPLNWDSPEVAAACERYLSVRKRVEKKKIAEIAEMLPEAVSADVKAELEFLLKFLNDLPFFCTPLPPGSRLYDGITEAVTDIISRIQEGPQTYHQDSLEKAFRDAGFVVPQPPPPSPPAQEPTDEEESTGEGDERESEGPSEASRSSGGSEATEDTSRGRKRRRPNVEACRYDKSIGPIEVLPDVDEEEQVVDGTWRKRRHMSLPSHLHWPE
ncbi:unnamed protein product [Vitrella brassicaformis CCMP3155]|uniref:Protein kinase domain-containing protein n=1 Tax=Vitrella brassicaformis (strain CCMP3155) TaxID=1169540 RepID=A0A0G4G3J5_VITBC|nr:unnamed protein product [Vitrella brassicaformis CCMP3155]|eukprot:CEM22833.1 unnamed protein product [Vitrella brassicaformis CCMP3155]